MKPGQSLDELCYPFIYETSWLCDYEVATDELCSQIGFVLSVLPEGFDDLAEDLDRLQPLAFHLNGSIRGRLAVDESDIAWLRERLSHYKAETRDLAPGFVLPRGPAPVPQLHLARSSAKKAIRLMVRLEQEGVAVPEVLPRLANVMCNFFFVLTRVINQRLGVAEISFLSRSYGSGSG
jgi:cob(I)alamin adenosyltransferase